MVGTSVTLGQFAYNEEVTLYNLHFQLFTNVPHQLWKKLLHSTADREEMSQKCYISSTWWKCHWQNKLVTTAAKEFRGANFDNMLTTTVFYKYLVYN